MQTYYVLDESGIQSVLYAIELNEKCPAIFDYITEPENGLWITKQSEHLRNQDRLSVSILVQNGANIFRKNENYEIDFTGKPFLLPMDLKTDIAISFDECETKTKTYCEQSESVMDTGTFCKDDIIFNEDFDERISNGIGKYWKHDISLRNNGNGDEEFVMFEKSIQTTFIRDGILHLLPRPRDGEIRTGSINLQHCTSKGKSRKEECAIEADAARFFLPPIISAQLSTEDSFRFKYGRVEIRAKLPKGDWIIPRLMLRSTYEGKPDIKIAFAVGNDYLENGTDYAHENIGGHVLSGGLIFWNFNKNKGVKEAHLDMRRHVSGEHYGNRFHVYSLTWTKSNLTFAVDDVTYGTIQKELDTEYYLVLGVSAGGHYIFPDNSKTGQLFPRPKPWTNLSHKAILKFWYDRENWIQTWQQNDQSLQVDYVRVYAL